MTEYKKGYKCFISYSGVDQKIKDVIQGYCDKLVEEYKKDGVEFSTWLMDRDGVGEWAKVFPKELEKKRWSNYDTFSSDSRNNICR